MNGFKIAKKIKSFDLISSMQKLIDFSLTPQEKKIIRYNKVPHLFLSPPIITGILEFKKLISTTTGNILLVYSDNLELFSPNQRLIKEKIMENSWNNFFEFSNKNNFGLVFGEKIEIYETDSCSLIKEIPFNQDYKKYRYTIIDDDRICLYSNKQAVIIKINTKEEYTIPLKTKEYFTIRPLKKDAIILLCSSKFKIYSLITKKCEKTYKYNKNEMYSGIVITDSYYVIRAISDRDGKTVIYGFSTYDYEMKYEKKVRQIISENILTKDYFLLTDEEGITMYDISNGDMITRYGMRKKMFNEFKKVFWRSERYVLVKRTYNNELYIIN